MKFGSSLFGCEKIKRRKLTHCNIYLSNVLHTVTVYNTAFNTQQNKSISYKIKWEGGELWCLGLVPLVFITSQAGLLLFKLSVQDSYFVCRCIIQSHQTDWGKEQEYGRMLWACTSMSADSHVLPFPAWGLEVKRILMTTDQTGMKKPPAVHELIIMQRLVARAWRRSPSTPQLTRIWLVSAPINNQATINRAINSYCNTLIYSIIQGSSVVTSSIYINTIYTHTHARTRCLQHKHAYGRCCSHVKLHKQSLLCLILSPFNEPLSFSSNIIYNIRKWFNAEPVLRFQIKRTETL